MEKVIPTTEFCIFKLVYVSNFNSNWQFRFVGPNLHQKGISGRKQKKWTSPLNSACSNWSEYQILIYTNNSDFLGQVCPKSVFPV